MPTTLRKRNLTHETPFHETIQNDLTNKNNPSGYEQSREKRIKENLERMQKLGIHDLSHIFNSSLPSKKTRPYSKKTPLNISHVGPTRRSSRLQNATPVSYTEVKVLRKDKYNGVCLEDGSRTEVYTEEHEKLLGDCKMSWTLFVDGCGTDGKRIYDPVKGKTCHQCRQKTLGHRTQCCKCELVQGQFCGDCLYMRYGEHVQEATQNPDWICPPCRGICNCSLCRQAKGWPPTGPLYRKISSLGYKSVAHYLIQTRRSQTSSGNDIRAPLSVKRSLPFSDIESPSKMKDLADTNIEDKKDDQLQIKRNNEYLQFQDNVVSVTNIASEDGLENMKCDLTNESIPDSVAGRLRKRKKQENNIGDKRNDASEVKNEDMLSQESVVGATNIPTGNSSGNKKCEVINEPSLDSIGGRLRQRRKQET